jgi:hypothetical protein
MPMLDPSVIVESVINTGFTALLANVQTQVPLILAQFPQEYINLAVSYLTDPTFKVTTMFQYSYVPDLMPCWNIVLASENEAAGNNQMFLNDVVDAADGDGSEYEQSGSDWLQKVNVYIRAQKEKQCIVLYALTKWLFLQNRLTFEKAGFKTPIFSGSDVMYGVERKPTFIFTRMLSISTRALQTVDVDISGDAILKSVNSEWPENVTVQSQADIGRG